MATQKKVIFKVKVMSYGIFCKNASKAPRYLTQEPALVNPFFKISFIKTTYPMVDPSLQFPLAPALTCMRTTASFVALPWRTALTDWTLDAHSDFFSTLKQIKELG